MPRGRKRKNSDLLSPLPAKVSRRETAAKANKKTTKTPRGKGRGFIQKLMYLI